MAVPFLSSISLNKNEVQDFKVFNYAGDVTPLTGTDIGYFWTNTTGGKTLRWWDGSAVRTILDSSSSVTATNISGGAAGELLYQSGLATTAKLAVGTDGYILTYDGTNTKPKWSASIPAGSVSGLAASATTDTTNAANISSGLLPLARLALATGQFYVGDASNNPAATAKSSISLTGFGALTADLDIAGFNIINSGNVTSGSSGSTLATKGYVDSVAQGLDIKASCLVASTADINLSAPGSGLIDGIDPATFTSGTTRILVKDQSLSQQNGIYIWNGTGSAMTRSLDANTWDELVGAFTFIEEGTANADSGWVCTANAGGTLGTTPVPFVKFSQAGSYTAGNGMVLSGGVFHFAKSTAYTEGQIPFCSNTPTANRIGFSSNLFWDNSNSRLGIGTATPAYPLDISASQAVSRLTSSTGTNGAFSFFSNTGGAFYIGLDNSAGTEFSAAYSGAIWHSGAYPIVFATSNAEKMRLDSSGNLLINRASVIGTNSKLNVQQHGTAASSYTAPSNAIASFDGGTNDNGVIALVGGGDQGIFKANSSGAYDVGISLGSNADRRIQFTTAGSPRMTLDASGNLLVGTTTATSKFVVSSSGDTLATIIGGAANAKGISFYDASTNGCQIYSVSSDIRFFTTASGSSTERLRIPSSGEIQAIGQGSASAPIFSRTGDTNTGLYFPAADTLALAVGGSDAIYIDSSRNVRIGGAAAVGVLTVTNSTTNTSIGLVNLSGYANTNTNSIDFYLDNSNSGVVTHAVIGCINTAATANRYGELFFKTASAAAPATRIRIKPQGQLNFVPLASDPAGGEAGDVYYNSTSNMLKWYGTAWNTLPRKYSGALSGTGTSFAVTHNLGTRDVTVQVRKSGSTYDLVYTDIQMTTTDTVTVVFASSVTGSDYTVTVIG